MPSRVAQNDEDGDGESAGSASLLAGPRNVKPYIARRGEQYMNKEQLEHFARILQNWKRDLMVEVDRTVLHMKDEAANFPDPNDRATQEEEFSLELRTRDRERKLIRKIDEALKRIEDGSYGYCLETGEEIGIKRLEARPVATLSVEAQERRERREKQYGDRDDRYRCARITPGPSPAMSARSRPRRPAICTWARSIRRWRAISTRERTADAGWCESRMWTERARSPGRGRAHPAHPAGIRFRMGRRDRPTSGSDGALCRCARRDCARAV